MENKIVKFINSCTNILISLHTLVHELVKIFKTLLPIIIYIEISKKINQLDISEMIELIKILK